MLVATMRLFLTTWLVILCSFVSQAILDASDCLQELHDAMANDRAEAIGSILSKHGKDECDINEIIPGGSGQTLLMAAVLNGKSPAMLETLLNHGADVTIGERDEYTPLHGAAFQGRAHAVPILLAREGVDLHDRHHDGFTPLQRACWGNKKRHAETVRVLLEYGADPDDPACRGDECVHLIESTRFLPTVEVLREYTTIEKYKKPDEGEL